MNGNPIMMQPLVRGPFGLATGEMDQALQPRQMNQKLYSKPSKGARPLGNDSIPQHLAIPVQSRTASHRNDSRNIHFDHLNSFSIYSIQDARSSISNDSNQSRESSNISGSNNYGLRGSYADRKNSSNYKGSRMHNQQQNHHQQSNTGYKRRDHTTAQNIPPNHSYFSFHPTMPHSPQSPRRLSNDSGIMLSSTAQKLLIPSTPSPPTTETFFRIPHHSLLQSTSNELQASQTQAYGPQDTQHFQPSITSTLREAADSNHSRDIYSSRRPFRSNHPELQQSREIHSRQNTRSMAFGTHTSAEVTYTHQPPYPETWNHHSQNTATEVTPSLPQQAAYDDPKDEDANLAPLSTGITTIATSAGAYGDGVTECDHDRLREQLEWYFSSRNLAKDTYLVSKMDADRWVPISVIAEFKKVKAITGDIHKVVNALRRSSAVSVDETGTMVKAVVVDRPRTTLILRELPEDAETEEINSIFAVAKCPVKSVTKETVGNMWFVEFETAEDALAMLLYTRGKYFRGVVPIAARLKSNAVLTGGDYRGAKMPSAISGDPKLPGFNPAQNWATTPELKSSFDPSLFGMQTPYRRFPAEETCEEEETWSDTPAQRAGLEAQEIPHHHTVNHVYSPEGYYLPHAYGVGPFATSEGVYYTDGQLWIPSPVFSAQPQESSHGQQRHSEHELLHPNQILAGRHAAGARRSSSDSLELYSGSEQERGGVDFVNRSDGGNDGNRAHTDEWEQLQQQPKHQHRLQQQRLQQHQYQHQYQQYRRQHQYRQHQYRHPNYQEYPRRQNGQQQCRLEYTELQTKEYRDRRDNQQRHHIGYKQERRTNDRREHAEYRQHDTHGLHHEYGTTQSRDRLDFQNPSPLPPWGLQSGGGHFLNRNLPKVGNDRGNFPGRYTSANTRSDMIFMGGLPQRQYQSQPQHQNQSQRLSYHPPTQSPHQSPTNTSSNNSEKKKKKNKKKAKSNHKERGTSGSSELEGNGEAQTEVIASMSTSASSSADMDKWPSPERKTSAPDEQSALGIETLEDATGEIEIVATQNPEVESIYGTLALDTTVWNQDITGEAMEPSTDDSKKKVAPESKESATVEGIDVSGQKQMHRVGAKMNQLSTDSSHGAGDQKLEPRRQRGSASQSAAKSTKEIHVPNLEKDMFPPLPSASGIQNNSTGARPRSPMLPSPGWVRSVKTLAEIASEAAAKDKPDRGDQSRDVADVKAQQKCRNANAAILNKTLRHQRQPSQSLQVVARVSAQHPAVVSTALEQWPVPALAIGKAATGANLKEEERQRSDVTDGEPSPWRPVNWGTVAALRPSGGFSYASAVIKAQQHTHLHTTLQQQEKEGAAESAIAMMSNSEKAGTEPHGKRL